MLFNAVNGKGPCGSQFCALHPGAEAGGQTTPSVYELALRVARHTEPARRTTTVFATYSSQSDRPPGILTLDAVVQVRETLHRVVVVDRLLFHRRDAGPEHLVKKPTKKTHGIGDVVGSPCRKAQELGQDVSDPGRVAGEIDLALRRARLEGPATRRLVSH